MSLIGVIGSAARRRAVTAFGGASRAFDGTNDSIDLPDISMSGAMSVSLWAKHNSATPTPYDSMAGQTSTNSWVDGWGLYFLNNDYRFWVETWNANVAFSSSLTFADWIHVVGTWDGTTVRIYTNNTEGTSDAYSGAMTGVANARIGRLFSDSYNWNGRIADVRIFNRAITSGEVSTLNGFGSVTSGLIYHGLPDTDDSGELDYSGNGNHGTNVGSTFSTDGPLD